MMNLLRKFAPLCLVLLLAGWIRFSLIPNGLPLLFHEDEPIYLTRALHFGHGDFNPDYFKKPSFFLYFYFAFYYLYYLISPFTSWSAFENSFYTDPTTITLIGRVITALFSTASVWWLYRIGQRCFSKAVGLGAALLLALDITHLRTSSFILSDIPALCMILAAAWFALSVYERGRWRDYLLCALFTALAISFKYNFFTVFFLVSAHGLRVLANAGTPRPLTSLAFWKACLGSPKFWGALACIPAVFVLLSPYTLLNFSKFFEDMNLERRHMTIRTISRTDRSFSPMIGFDNIFFQILPKALGWPLYLTGLAGVLLALCISLGKEKESRFRQWVLLSFPLVFLMVLSQFRLINAKYLMPILPFWFLMAAAVTVFAAQKLRERVNFMRPVWVYPVLLGLVALPMLKDTTQYVSLHRHQDTRTMARLYLEKNLAPGTRIFSEPETVAITSWLPQKEEGILAVKPPQGVGFHRLGDSRMDPGSLSAHRPPYVMIHLKPVRDRQGNKVLPYAPEYYAHLLQHYRIQAIFSPYPMKQTPEELQAMGDFLGIYNTLRQNKKDIRHPGPLLILLEERSP